MNELNFALNIKLLRKRKKQSQEDMAKVLGISRSAYNSYENGGIEPNFTTLINLANHFQINTADLLSKDLSKLKENQLEDMASGKSDKDISGKGLRILTTTVNQENENNIELVPMQARAGYTNGFADPEFIKVLPTFNLPFLSEKKKYRTFPIKGDSMPPVKNGAFVTGEFVDNWYAIQNGFPYIIVTKEDGIVFKTVYHDLKNKPHLLLCSSNPAYEPYEVDVREVLEVWKFVNYINHEFEPESMDNSAITNALLDLKKDISSIKMGMVNA